MAEDIAREARERYAAGVDADRLNRARDQEDRLFYTGGDNQWMVTGANGTVNVANQRRAKGRPAASYNRLPQFVKQVSGELRQNKPAIKVLPVDGQTDPAMAEVYSAIIRHIEGQSNGHRIYSKTGEQAAIGGQGWWRIKADYCADDGFEQELLIERIPNPLAVVSDPAAKEPTRRDMSWALVTEMVPRQDFLDKYPKISASDFDGEEYLDWQQGDFVRIAEYWRKRSKGTKRLFALRAPTGEQTVADEDQIRERLAPFGLEKVNKASLAQLELEIVSERKVEAFVVESILLCGVGELGEWQEWPGKYIPLVRVVGEEVEAGDTVFRHGMIHHAKPAQVGYNYARNAMMERHGQSTKAPWIATAKQVQNYKGMWETANTENHAVLIYDPDPAANGPPARTAPPQLDAAAYQECMTAVDDMKGSTGIHDAQLGAESNETSGVAIARRDAQGDTATFVYIDNLEDAIETTGRMLIDLIPHYYDDSRVIRLLGEDGEVEKFEEINKQLPDGRTWNDVTRGKYDVVVNTGPAYATRRQEAADNLMKLSDNPVIGQVGMDILVRALDMPLGDKLADRLKRMLPPGLDDDADKERGEREQQGQGQPEQPSPEQMKMQADQQIAQAKLEMDGQAAQAKLQIQDQEVRAKLALAQAEAEAEMELAERRQYAEMELARERFEFEMKLALQKAGLDARIAEHNAELKERGADHAAHLAERKADQPQPKKAAAK
jgi:hypothetical protein